ncbi:Zinc finger MYM-type protein 1 [Eumeta japonica]|uniref:Zinc finger MYM-type protein 1 n=1 Tax=Eumeta variegata TaxID=151549 RepID=A0A4C1Y553_EUMVA|nr:Zinc finger MYM-type protein 1 [Eumeta japonica]
MNVFVFCLSESGDRPATRSVGRKLSGGQVGAGAAACADKCPCFRKGKKSKKRVKRHNLKKSSDTGYDITSQQGFKINTYEEIDNIIFEFTWRFKKLHNIHHLFHCLTREEIVNYPAEELKKHAADLSIKYSADINATEFWVELDTLKAQLETTILFDKCDRSSSLGLLKAIIDLDVKEMFPNVVVAIKIFLTMPVTVASCERSFSELKLITIYLCSAIGQERLTGLANLSVKRVIERCLS